MGRRSCSVALAAVSIISVITLFHDWGDVNEWYRLEAKLSYSNHHDESATADDQDNKTAADINAPRTKCVAWTRETAFNRSVQSIDKWWTENPAWFSHTTNDTHACWIEETQRSTRRNYAHQMYVNQHLQGCSRLHYRIMWSSGWGADFKNILGAMEEGHTRHHVPAVVGWDYIHNVPKAWHYSANKERDITLPNGTVDYSRLNPTCPEKDLSCYFLPYHNCGSLQHLVNDTKHLFVGKIGGDHLDEMPLDTKGKYYYEWLSRPLIWFRRGVLDYQQDQGLVARLEANLVTSEASTNNEENDIDRKRGQCSVLHVRRADIAHHNKYSRKYFAISDYLAKLPADANKQHLVLLTDDANAIDEALEFYPNRTWYFYNRTRHRGSSGGWEHQVPSMDPALEVIAMFATFDLLEQYCSHLVYGFSSFSEYLWYYMKRKMERKRIPTYRHRVEDNTRKVFDETHKSTESELNERLAKYRKEKREIGQ